MFGNVKMKDVVLTFVNAIDVVNPILKHHHRRVSILAYHIGKSFGLNDEEMANLIIAASLHDIGALTVADQDELSVLDVDDPRPHELLGSYMLSSFEPFSEIVKIIDTHHVNYSEQSLRDRGKVPVSSYVVHLADRIDILLKRAKISLNQKEDIKETIKELSGSLFMPEVVDAFLRIADVEQVWLELDDISMAQLYERIDFDFFDFDMSEGALENLVYTLSRIVDYKSKFTIAHSIRVAHVAEMLSEYMGMDEDECFKLKIAGYLHDYGKIAIPAEIIMKPGELSHEEFNIVKAHPYYTHQILGHIDGLSEIAELAGAHHEKRDQSGYPQKPDASEMDLQLEVLIYSDLFAALTEDRPYRKALKCGEALRIIEEEYQSIVGSAPLKALKDNAQEIYEKIHLIQEDLVVMYDNKILTKKTYDHKKNHYLKRELYDLIKVDNDIFDFIQEGSLDGMWYWDLEKPEHEWMSKAFWNLFGYDPDEKEHLAEEWQDMIFPEDLQLAIENFTKHCEDPSHPYDQIVRYRHKNGSTVWVRCRGIAIRDKNGKAIRMLGAHTDITELKELQLELERKNREMLEKQREIEGLNVSLEKLSTEDALTGLYNRHMIDKLMVEEHHRADRHKSHFSIFLMDVNKFKIINDTYGHLVGDEVLKDLADRLRSGLRAQDIKARWGGDEFLVLLPDTSAVNAEYLAQKMEEEQKNWFIEHQGKRIYYSVTIGIASYRTGEPMMLLLHRADADLYHKKSNRK